ncbi:MAG: UDP-glucose 4-epimerase [Planctomycetota bacterium]|nr:MAG: UDP-glucose 4-epimerase [Planctomycetota bacterium]
MVPYRHAVITGGAGFIGSHLAERLLAGGTRVTVLDDLSTGRRANLQAFLARGGRFVQGDAADPRLVRELFAEADAVVHLAAAVGVRLVVERAAECIERNLEPTRVVLFEAARRGLPVVLASSSEVYGRAAGARFHEEDDLVLGPPSRPRWAYACSKLLDEFLALALVRERGLRAVVVRLFNTVGPRQSGRWGMVLPRFIEQARAGGPLTVYGDGTQSRCFTWVGDVVRGLEALLSCEAAWGKVVNLGSDEEVTIRELAERVRARLNPAAPIAYVPYAEAYGPGFDDMPRRRPDLRRARELIGWQPTLDLEAIIDALARTPPGGPLPGGA